MRPGSEPFLHTICASPDDDVPRLVYADWLDEHGDPDRAEFIRLQVADPDRADRPDVPDREFELRDRNREVWRAELPTLSGVGWGKFRRGFVSGVTFTGWKFFLRYAEATFAVAPVDELRFPNLTPGQWRAFLQSPHLSRVRRLDTGQSRLGDEELFWLAHADGAGGLEALTCGGFRPDPTDWIRPGLGISLVTDTGAEHLIRTDRLPRMRRLVLRSSAISPDVMAALRAKYGPDVRAG